MNMEWQRHDLSAIQRHIRALTLLALIVSNLTLAFKRFLYIPDRNEKGRIFP